MLGWPDAIVAIFLIAFAASLAEIWLRSKGGQS